MKSMSSSFMMGQSFMHDDPNMMLPWNMMLLQAKMDEAAAVATT